MEIFVGKLWLIYLSIFRHLPQESEILLGIKYERVEKLLKQAKKLYIEEARNSHS